MKFWKVLAISTALVFIVSVAWSWNQGNGRGQHGKGYHKGYQSCAGQGTGFVDKNNDGVCDYYTAGKTGSGKKYRNCLSGNGQGRMKQRANCPYLNQTEPEKQTKTE